MLAPVLSLLVPPRCAACGAPSTVGRWLCHACQAALPWLGPELCPACALPLPCGPPCPARRSAFAAAWAPVALEGPARALVHALKFGGRTAVADVMAAQMLANVPRGLLGPEACLVPAPAHPARRRERGFDQAMVLARRLGRRVRLPVVAALARSGAARRQTGAGRRERLLGVEVRATRPVAGSVVLIDDVHTTGATLQACALALRAAGATSVVALTYARTLP